MFRCFLNRFHPTTAEIRQSLRRTYKIDTRQIEGRSKRNSHVPNSIYSRLARHNAQKLIKDLSLAPTNQRAVKDIASVDELELRRRKLRICKFLQLLHSTWIPSGEEIWKAYVDILSLPGGVTYLLPSHLRHLRAILRLDPDSKTLERVLSIFQLQMTIFGKEEMARRDRKEYLYTLATAGLYRKALDVFNEYRMEGKSFSVNEWNVKLDAELHLADMTFHQPGDTATAMIAVSRKAELILKEFEQAGIDPDANTFANIICYLLRKDLFEANSSLAVLWLNRMQDLLKPPLIPVIGFVRILRMLEFREEPIMGLRLLLWMKRHDVQMTSQLRRLLVCALIKQLGILGKEEEMETVYNKVMGKKARKFIATESEMQRLYTGFLEGFIQLGHVEKTLQALKTMIFADQAIFPRTLHRLSCFLDKLKRERQLL